MLFGICNSEAPIVGSANRNNYNPLKLKWISFCPLIGAGPSPFTVERTKHVLNPEVPFAQGSPTFLPSALRAAPDFRLARSPLLQKNSQCPFLTQRACWWKKLSGTGGIHGIEAINRFTLNEPLDYVDNKLRSEVINEDDYFGTNNSTSPRSKERSVE